MPRIRYVAALLRSEEEIVGSWINCSQELAKMKADSIKESMMDPAGLVDFVTDSGFVIIPNAHIEYMALEYEAGT